MSELAISLLVSTLVGRRGGTDDDVADSASSQRRGEPNGEPRTGERVRVRTGETDRLRIPPDERIVRAAWSGVECTLAHTGGSFTVARARFSSASCFEAASSATASRTDIYGEGGLRGDRGE